MARTHTNAFRIWPGDYSDPLGPWHPVDEFLAVIDRECPEVAANLWQAYTQAGGDRVGPQDAWFTLLRMVAKHNDPEQPEPDPQTVERVWKPVLDWAVGCHLILSPDACLTAWGSTRSPADAYHRDLLEAVYSSLCFPQPPFTFSRGLSRVIRTSVLNDVATSLCFPSLDTHEQITISLPRIDLTRETEQDAEARYLRAFNAEFDRLLQAARGRMEDAGHEPVPARVGREHFRWLAMFQVGGRSKNSIATEVRKQWGAVQNGIQRAAALLVGEDSRDRWLRKAPGDQGGQ